MMDPPSRELYPGIYPDFLFLACKDCGAEVDIRGRRVRRAGACNYLRQRVAPGWLCRSSGPTRPISVSADGARYPERRGRGIFPWAHQAIGDRRSPSTPRRLLSPGGAMRRLQSYAALSAGLTVLIPRICRKPATTFPPPAFPPRMSWRQLLRCGRSPGSIPTMLCCLVTPLAGLP